MILNVPSVMTSTWRCRSRRAGAFREGRSASPAIRCPPLSDKHHRVDEFAGGQAEQRLGVALDIVAQRHQRQEAQRRDDDQEDDDQVGYRAAAATARQPEDAGRQVQR